MFAMHMADSLLNPAVAITMLIVAAACLALASWRTKARFDADKVPLMGVMGAFVFAAQMINFPILGGTSGHLGGGVLLAILLGPHAATLVMASILAIQCLIFQDGGLLALGANIVNLGVIPCYLGYALFRTMAGRSPNPSRLYAAMFIATMAGMLAGAAAVPFQVYAANMLTVPLTEFLLVMLGLHVLVATGEALITFLVVVYLVSVRPQVLGHLTAHWPASRVKLKPAMVLASVAVMAALLGGLVSLYASEWPDALEAATVEAKTQRVAEADPTMEKTEQFHEKIAPLPDYEFTSFSGIGGAAVTLGAVWLIGWMLRRKQKPVAEG